jgi:hypothetical protein
MIHGRSTSATTVPATRLGGGAPILRASDDEDNPALWRSSSDETRAARSTTWGRRAVLIPPPSAPSPSPAPSPSLSRPHSCRTPAGAHGLGWRRGRSTGCLTPCLDYADTAETNAMRDDMRRINACLEEASITFTGNEGDPVDVHDRTLRRLSSSTRTTLSGNASI